MSPQAPLQASTFQPWVLRSSVALLGAIALSLPLSAQHRSSIQGPSTASALRGEATPPVALRRESPEAMGQAPFTVGNTHTGGVAWVDYNGDYWPDLFLTNGAGLPHYLFRNNGNGRFTNVSHLVPKPNPALESAGVKYADFDNDGDNDLLVVVDNPNQVVPSQPNSYEGGPNLLYVNQGGGAGFVEAGAALGVVDPRGWRTICASLADYDRDGWVDVFLGNWAILGGGAPNGDHLLRNAQGMHFVDVTPATGVDGAGRDALVSLFFDVDLDGWPELYVGNVGNEHAPPVQDTTDVFYYNLEGDFLEVGGLVPGLCDDAVAAMGMDVGDIDNDGDWDFYITDVYDRPPAPLGNVLYLGDPDVGLSDNVCDLAGVCADDSWPCNFADFDRDGWIDLWVGHANPAEAGFVYRNRGDGTFDDVTPAALGGNAARGGALADYDGDGDVDLCIWNQAMPSALYRNETNDGNNWLEVLCVGAVSSRDAIGTLLRAQTAASTQMRRVTGGDSAHSQSMAAVHFGFGAASEVDLQVDWPSGIQQTFEDVPLNQFMIVHETQGLLTEAIESSAVVYDEAARLLEIEVVSNFGGRTELSVEGAGELAWDPERTRFVGSFEKGDVADELRVVSKRGVSWARTDCGSSRRRAPSARSGGRRTSRPRGRARTGFARPPTFAGTARGVESRLRRQRPSGARSPRVAS